MSALTPTGRLRASINVGNPILAHRDADGRPGGVSVDVAGEFARRLGVELELIDFDRAADSVAAVRGEQADIGFFAVDPARSDGLLFTAPYVLIEGSYLVPVGSGLIENAQVDKAGTRMSVKSGSAYDLYLTRVLTAAELVRFDDVASSLAALRGGEVEVAAGIRQLMQAESERTPELRVLPGRFMVIEQAIGTPSSRGPDAQRELADFVEELKATGFVADALTRHNVTGASVAPPASRRTTNGQLRYEWPVITGHSCANWPFVGDGEEAVPRQIEVKPSAARVDNPS